MALARAVATAIRASYPDIDTSLVDVLVIHMFADDFGFRHVEIAEVFHISRSKVDKDCEKGRSFYDSVPIYHSIYEKTRAWILEAVPPRG